MIATFAEKPKKWRNDQLRAGRRVAWEIHTRTQSRTHAPTHTHALTRVHVCLCVCVCLHADKSSEGTMGPVGLDFGHWFKRLFGS